MNPLIATKNNCNIVPIEETFLYYDNILTNIIKKNRERKKEEIANYKGSFSEQISDLFDQALSDDINSFLHSRIT